MKPALLLAILSVFSNSTPEMVRGYDTNGKLSFKVEMNNGMMNGVFAKYDPASGKIVAEGNFKNNLRNGTWKIYKDDKLVAQREYKNGFEFEIKYVPKEGQTTKPPVTKKYDLKRNNKNFIDYSVLGDNDVAWSKRVWRKIETNETNSVFFDNNKFFGHLFKLIHAGKIKVYDTISDEFKTELTHEAFKTVLPVGDFEITAWKLKEDWMYMPAKMLYEPRIVGLCPVIKDKKTNKTYDLCWMYYPLIREYLAGFKVEKKDEPRIQHADDVFYFRYFSGVIYKETNIHNRKIDDYAKGDAALAEAMRIEVDLICTGHGFWVK